MTEEVVPQEVNPKEVVPEKITKEEQGGQEGCILLCVFAYVGQSVGRLFVGFFLRQYFAAYKEEGFESTIRLAYFAVVVLNEDG